ncbi:MAG: hypothetical protein ACTHU0_21955 [Kofleriaceae bacterium]
MTAGVRGEDESSPETELKAYLVEHVPNGRFGYGLAALCVVRADGVLDEARSFRGPLLRAASSWAEIQETAAVAGYTVVPLSTLRERMHLAFTLRTACLRERAVVDRLDDPRLSARLQAHIDRACAAHVAAQNDAAAMMEEPDSAALRSPRTGGRGR